MSARIASPAPVLPPFFTLLLPIVFSMLFSLPAAAESTVKIGLNYPATGRYQEQGLAQARGALMAIDEINAQGGILGHPVELLRKDTASDPQRAADNVSTLAAQGAVMMFGGASSTATVAAGNEAEKHNLLYFGTLGYANDITGLDGQKDMFREPYSSYMAARALAEYMNQHFSGKKFFYITAGYSEGWSMEAALRSFTGTQGVTVHPGVRTPYPHPMGKDFDKALHQAVAAGAQVLVLIQLGEDMVMALHEAYNLGLKNKMTIVVPNLTLGMAEQAGAGLMAGVIGAVPWCWEVPFKYGYQRGEDFVHAFVKQYQLYPSSSAASAYSIVYQYRDAVQRAGSLDTGKVVAALENYHYSFLKDQQYWRGFDHQNVQSVYVVRSRPRSEIMKSNDFEDFFDVLLQVPGGDVAMGRTEWEMERRINDKPLVLQ